MTRYQNHTTGTITTNKEAIQLYLGVQFSRSPHNPLRTADEYAAFCDSGVVVVFPTERLPSFPFEVTLPDEIEHELLNP